MSVIEDALINVLKDPKYDDLSERTKIDFQNAIIAYQAIERQFEIMVVAQAMMNSWNQQSYPLEGSEQFRWLIREADRFGEAAN